MAIADYEAKFVELSHFASMFVADEKKNTDCFKMDCTLRSRQRQRCITIAALQTWLQEQLEQRKLRSFIIENKKGVREAHRVFPWI